MKRVTKWVCGLAVSMVLTMPLTVMAEEAAFTIDYDNFQEIVLVDDANCLLKITGVQVDASYNWNVQLENRTETELMFSIRNASINDYMCDPYWGVSLEPGATAENSVEWMETVLNQNGIEHVEEVNFELVVYDNENWGADDLVHTEIQIECACGEEPAGSAAPEEGIVLADNENLFMIANGIYVDDEWGEYMCDVYVENKTDYNLYVSLDNVCMNGFECDPYWGGELKAGAKMFTAFSWYSDTLEEYGFDDIYVVEGTVKAHCEDDWEMDDLANEPFAIYPYGEDGVQEQNRVPFENETVVLDNEYCTMILGGLEQDEYRCLARVYLENKTDTVAMFALEDVLVDGIECDPYWADTVPAGKKGYSNLVWYNDELQSLDIEMPTTIEGKLHVYDDENYDTDYFEGNVTLLGDGTAAGTVEPETEVTTEAPTEAEPSPYDEEAFKAEAEAEFRAVTADPASLEEASDFVYAVISCMCGNSEAIMGDEVYAPVIEYLETRGFDLEAEARNYMEELGISRRECVALKAALGRL